LAAERGRKMRGLGVTVDFAPVVDVTSAPDDTVIGDRSFGADPKTVTDYAGAYAQGLRDAGLLPVLKHFPGHGHASGDPHKGGVVTPPLSDLQNNDLVPYRTLVAADPVAVMVGHLQVPELTGDDPATLSRAAVQLLRTGTGYNGPAFDGPIFSDRPVQHGGDIGPLRRTGGGAAQPAGRHRHRALGHHQRGARGPEGAGTGLERRQIG
jgi:beta-N-acetylhexosaminidase